ncbi:MAG TPA: TonB family protein [Kofleriaceae bacterium]|nr:TonB family protein [Kofleriaceae bacterium]
MSRRKLLIGASIAGHVALFTGVFVHGVWNLDQLEYESRFRAPLAFMTPPPPQGGSVAPAKVELQPKAVPKVVVKEPRQPPRVPERPEVTHEPGSSEPGTGLGTGPGTGPGDEDSPEAADPCKEAGPGCGTLPAPPLPEVPRPPPPPKVHAVTPQILKGLRIRGETAIHPPREVFHEMHRGGDLRTSASIKVCLAANGAVASVAVMKSTRYAAYDEAILAAARRWIYRPYSVNGTPVPACGMVTFVYEMK